MPEFLDEFSRELNAKHDRMTRLIMKGRESPLDSRFESALNEYWEDLPDKNSSGPVLAIDASSAHRQFDNGVQLYIVRALGVLADQRFRRVDADCFLTRSQAREVSTFIGLKMEFAEFSVALDAIDTGRMDEGCILFDGSLYGRAIHLTRDSPAEGQEEFILQYYDLYSRLQEECKRRRIVPIGVSKDSRATFLRDFLLLRILEEDLSQLQSSISPLHTRRLKEILQLMPWNPVQGWQEFHELARKYPDLSSFNETVREAASARSDHQLIMNYAQSMGMTSPLELGPPASMDMPGRLRRGIMNYINRSFRRSLANASDRERFIERASASLRKQAKLSTTVSFHVLLDERDTPLRVDIPSWVFRIEHSMADFAGPEAADVDLGEVLSPLIVGYGGLRCYNIWLKRVDEEVRLRRKVMDNIYTRLLERSVGQLVRHTRGYRRVTYP